MSLKNVAGYIANLGKSVAYSTVEQISKDNQTIKEYKDTNAELFKNIYSDLRNYKTTYKRAFDSISKTKEFEAVSSGFKFALEDLKTGKFYNKDRINKIQDDILGFSSSDDNWDISDDGFDMGSDDDFGSFDMTDITTGDKVVSTAVLESSKSSAEMISNSVIKGAELTSNAQRTSTSLLYTQNARAFSLFNSNLDSINKHMNSLNENSVKQLQNLNDNTKTFFEKATSLLEDQTALLRELVNNTKPSTELQDQRNNKKKRLTYDDIVTGNGAVNLKEYAKLVKNNIKNLGGGTAGFADMFQDGNALMSLVSSPLSFITDKFVANMISTGVKKSITNFNNSLQGFFGSLMAKFNNMANDDNDDTGFISKIIGKVFGIKEPTKSSLDTSKYEKGKVSWDGKSKKALEEVIPTQLSTIISILSNSPMKMFNYDTGKFIDMKSVKDSFENRQKGYYRNASSDMRDSFNKQIERNLTFNSKEDKKHLEDSIERVFKELYSSGELFDFKQKNARSKLAVKYGITEKDMAVIMSLFAGAPRALQMQLSHNIMETRHNQKRVMMDDEEKGSINRLLFNNSDSLGTHTYDKKGRISKDSSILSQNNILNVKDKLGRNVFYYLQNMYKELKYIRVYGSTNGMATGRGINLSDNRMTSIEVNGVRDTRKFVRTQPSIDDIHIEEDKSNKSFATRDREERERQEKAFARDEERRRKKDEKTKNLINYSEIDDEGILASRIKTNNQLYETQQKMEEYQNRAKQPETLIDKLLYADSVSKKFSVISTRLQKLAQKPMDFFTKAIDKADQRLYEVIYGKDTDENGKQKGFLNVLIKKMSDTFRRFNDFLDEKVLKPLKEATHMDEVKKAIKDFFTENIKNPLKERFKGIWGDIKDSFSNTWKSITGSVKDAFKTTFGPLKDKFKRKRADKLKNNAIGLDEETDEYASYDAEGNLIDNFSMTGGERKSADYYKDFDPFSAADNDEIRYKYIKAEQEYANNYVNKNKKKARNLIAEEAKKNKRNKKKHQSIYDKYTNSNKYDSETTIDMQRLNNLYVKHSNNTISDSELQEMKAIENRLVSNKIIPKKDLNKLYLSQYNLSNRDKLMPSELKDFATQKSILGNQEERNFVENYKIKKEAKRIEDKYKMRTDTKNSFLKDYIGISDKLDLSTSEKNALKVALLGVLSDPRKLDNIKGLQNYSIDQLYNAISKNNDKYKDKANKEKAKAKPEDYDRIDKKYSAYRNILDKMNTFKDNNNMTGKESILLDILGLDKYIGKKAGVDLSQPSKEESFKDFLGLNEAQASALLRTYTDNKNIDSFEQLYQALNDRNNDFKIHAIEKKMSSDFDKHGKIEKRYAVHQELMDKIKNLSDEDKNILLKKLKNSLNPAKKQNPEELYQEIETADKYIGNKEYRELKEQGKLTTDSVYDMYPNLISGMNEQYEKQNSLSDKLLGYVKEIRDKLIGPRQPQSGVPGHPTMPNLNNLSSDSIQVGSEYQEEYDATKKWTKGLFDTVYQYIWGSMPHFAKGTTESAKGVEESTVATLSKGEAVLSADNVKTIKETMTEIQQGLMQLMPILQIDDTDARNEAINGFKSKMMSLNDKVGGFEDRGIIERAMNSNDLTKEQMSKLAKSGKLQVLQNAIKGTYNSIAIHNKQDFDENGIPLDPELRASYEQSRPYIERMYETAINGVSTFSESLFGTSSEKNKENFKKAADDITSDIRKYAPEAITGGVIGGGVSLLTGAIGGPLLGAAVGAGISLVKKSEAAQNWLFGELKDGERQGGVITKDMVKFLKTSGADAKRLGIVGAATGLLPFGPLGPVGGLILGASAGFLKNTEGVQDLLFGDPKDSLFGDKKKFQEKVDKLVPHAGVGALLGAVTTPFGLGLLPSVALGAAAGLATTNNKFRELVIGTKDEDGKYQGGLLPTVRDNLIVPLKRSLKKARENLKNKMEEILFKPLKELVHNTKDMVKGILKSAKNTLLDFLDKRFLKSKGVPFRKWLEDKLLKPVLAPFRLVGKLGIGALTAVPKLIGGTAKFISNREKVFNINRGYSTNTTAQERMNIRNQSFYNKHVRYGNPLFNLLPQSVKDKVLANGGIGSDSASKFRKVDEGLVQLSDEGLEELRNGLMQYRATKDENFDLLKHQTKDLANTVNPYFKYGTSKKIMKAYQNGDIDAAEKMVLNSKFDFNNKQQLQDEIDNFIRDARAKGKYTDLTDDQLRAKALPELENLKKKSIIENLRKKGQEYKNFKEGKYNVSEDKIKDFQKSFKESFGLDISTHLDSEKMLELLDTEMSNRKDRSSADDALKTEAEKLQEKQNQLLEEQMKNESKYQTDLLSAVRTMSLQLKMIANPDYVPTADEQKLARTGALPSKQDQIDANQKALDEAKKNQQAEVPEDPLDNLNAITENRDIKNDIADMFTNNHKRMADRIKDAEQSKPLDEYTAGRINRKIQTIMNNPSLSDEDKREAVKGIQDKYGTRINNTKQIKATKQMKISEAVDNIMRNPALSKEEKKKRINQLKAQYPGSIFSIFGSPAVLRAKDKQITVEDDKLADVQPGQLNDTINKILDPNYDKNKESTNNQENNSSWGIGESINNNHSSNKRIDRGDHYIEKTTTENDKKGIIENPIKSLPQPETTPIDSKEKGDDRPSGGILDDNPNDGKTDLMTSDMQQYRVKKNISGDLVPDKSDPNTRKTIKEMEQEKKDKKSIIEKLKEGGLALGGIAKDGLGNAAGAVKEKSKSIFDSLFGGNGIGTILKLIFGGSLLISFLKGKFNLGDIGGSIFNTVGSAGKSILNWGLDKLGLKDTRKTSYVNSKGETVDSDNITYDEEFGTYTDENGNMVKEVSTGQSPLGQVGSKALKAEGRFLTTGGKFSIPRLLLNKSANKITEKGILWKLRHPLKTSKGLLSKANLKLSDKVTGLEDKAAKSLASKVSGNSAEDIVKNASEAAEGTYKTGVGFTTNAIENEAKYAAGEGVKITNNGIMEAVKKDGVSNATKEGIEKLGKEGAESTLKSGAESVAKSGAESIVNGALDETGKTVARSVSKDGIKVAEGTAKNVAESIGKEGLKAKFITKVADIFRKIAGSSFMKRILGKEGATKLLKEGATKLVKKLAEKLTGTVLAKVAGKITAAIGTAGLITAAFAIADFISGYNDANNILGITSELGLGSKVIAGLVNALNGVITLGIFPTSWWIDLFAFVTSKICGDAQSDLIKARQDSQAKVSEFNSKYNTNYTIEDYNNAVDHGDIDPETNTDNSGDTSDNNTSKKSWLSKFGSGAWSTFKHVINPLSWITFDLPSGGPDDDKLPENQLNGIQTAKKYNSANHDYRTMSLNDLHSRTISENKSQLTYKILNANKEFRRSAKSGKNYYSSDSTYKPYKDLTEINRLGKLAGLVNDEQLAKAQGIKNNIGGAEDYPGFNSSNDLRYAKLNTQIGYKTSESLLKDYMNKLHPETGISRLSGAFIQAGEKTGLDPKYLFAHCMNETGWGSSDIWKDKNNPFGIAAYNSSPYSSAKHFNSPEDGVVGGAQWIKDNFITPGQDTMQKMIYGAKGHEYAVNNDKTPNDGWITTNTGIMWNTPTTRSGDAGHDIDTTNGSYDASKIENNSASYDGNSSSSNSSDSEPSILSFFTDIATLASKAVNTLFGFDSGTNNSTSSNSNSSGASNYKSKTGKLDSDAWFNSSLNDAIVTSPYNEKRTRDDGSVYYHTGIDYSGDVEGKNIVSPINGIVEDVQSESASGGYGNLLKISETDSDEAHNGSIHYFAHMKSMPNKDGTQLKKGTAISMGDVVGQVGRTGNSSGPHLHYEIRDKSDASSVDPNAYLSGDTAFTKRFGTGGPDKESSPTNLLNTKDTYKKYNKYVGGPDTGKSVDNLNSKSAKQIGTGFGNVSSDDKKNGAIYFNQADDRWGSHKYGNGTVQSSGCGPTSMAMLIDSVTGNSVTPDETADWSMAHNGYVSGQGTSFSYFPAQGKEYGITMTQTNDYNGALLDALKNGQPAILSGQGGKPFSRGGHLVFAVGADQDGNVKINNPGDRYDKEVRPMKDIINAGMINSWYSDKKLDGTSVDGASSGSSNGSSGSSNGSSGSNDSSPSLYQFFSDMATEAGRSFNSLMGFKNTDNTSNTSNTSDDNAGNGYSKDELKNSMDNNMKKMSNDNKNKDEDDEEEGAGFGEHRKITNPKNLKLRNPMNSTGMGFGENDGNKINSNINNSISKSDYNNLLKVIIQTLLKISDNTGCLNKIVEILVERLGNTNSNTASNTASNLVSILSNSDNNQNPDNEYLMQILNKLATE